MNYIKLLMSPFEIVLITFLTLLASIVLSIYFIVCIIVEMITKGYKNGFRRSTS